MDPLSINYFIMIYCIIPIYIWMYSGFTWISLTIDNSNIGFNIPIIIAFIEIWINISYFTIVYT
jgi:hypothetical protein